MYVDIGGIVIRPSCMNFLFIMFYYNLKNDWNGTHLSIITLENVL